MKFNTIKLLSSLLLAGLVSAQSTDVDCSDIVCPTTYKQCNYLERQCCDNTLCQLPAKMVADNYKTFFKPPKETKTATVTTSKTKTKTAKPTPTVDCSNVQCPDCQPYCYFCEDDIATCCPSQCRRSSEFQVDPNDCQYIDCGKLSGKCDVVERFCCGLKRCNKLIEVEDVDECDGFECPYRSFCDSFQKMCCGHNLCNKEDK